MITKTVEEDIRCNVGIRDGLVAVYLHNEDEDVILLRPDQAEIMAKRLSYWAKALENER